jgi:dihydroorotate dehydrogenase electron transfer subunit
VVALVGFRDATQAQGVAPLKAAVARIAESALSCRLEVATEDGSLGRSQKVTDLLEAELRTDDRVVVCGPAAMLAAVWQVCHAVGGVRTWFSLEASMACGVGSCHGCAIALSDGSFARVCREGPVFPGEKVFALSLGSFESAKEPA